MHIELIHFATIFWPKVMQWRSASFSPYSPQGKNVRWFPTLIAFGKKEVGLDEEAVKKRWKTGAFWWTRCSQAIYELPTVSVRGVPFFVGWIGSLGISGAQPDSVYWRRWKTWTATKRKSLLSKLWIALTLASVRDRSDVLIFRFAKNCRTRPLDKIQRSFFYSYYSFVFLTITIEVTLLSIVHYQ